MLEVIRTRKSVRTYAATPIAAETVQLLGEAIELAPTSRNLASRRFEWVTDAATLNRLSLAKAHGSAFVANAPLAVVVCGLPEVSDVWIEDCAIAAITLQYAATSLGLGSCWAQIRERSDAQGRSSELAVKEVLDLPEDIRVECIIALGHPTP